MPSGIVRLAVSFIGASNRIYVLLQLGRKVAMCFGKVQELLIKYVLLRI